MSKTSPRMQRVNDLIQKTLAELLRREIQDPRVKHVTILAVEITRDLAHAKVFFSVLDPEKVPEVLKALEGASGFMRRLLAKKVDLRITPQLHFVYDNSSVHGQYMNDLIEKARAKSKKPDDDESSTKSD